jgi:hypothetical protein
MGTDSDNETLEVAEGPVEVLDLAHLRDLLGLLRDMQVHQFSAGGISVGFHGKGYEPPEMTAAEKAAEMTDDGHSTSNRRVSGFSKESITAWNNPLLWPGQNGKRLRFDGSLE